MVLSIPLGADRHGAESAAAELDPSALGAAIAAKHLEPPDREVLRAVAPVCAVTVANRRGPSRVREVSHARQIAASVLRQRYPALSLTGIGARPGGATTRR